MDISTLGKTLAERKYSRIPPNAGDPEDEENPIANHPVYKMAYGPFYEDAMLIFGKLYHVMITDHQSNRT